MSYFVISKELRQKIIDHGCEANLARARNLFYIVSKRYNVKIHLYWDARFYKDSAGFARHPNKVYLASSLLKYSFPSECLSVLFHELGHIHCLKSGIWQAYHIGSDKEACKTTAWKAEKWVDRWGKSQMQEVFPDIKYAGFNSIDEPVDRSFYSKMVDEWF